MPDQLPTDYESPYTREARYTTWFFELKDGVCEICRDRSSER